MIGRGMRRIRSRGVAARRGTGSRSGGAAAVSGSRRSLVLGQFEAGQVRCLTATEAGRQLRRPAAEARGQPGVRGLLGALALALRGALGLLLAGLHGVAAALPVLLALLPGLDRLLPAAAHTRHAG